MCSISEYSSYLELKCCPTKDSRAEVEKAHGMALIRVNGQSDKKSEIPVTCLPRKCQVGSRHSSCRQGLYGKS